MKTMVSSGFLQYQATQKLQALARNPLDLTKDGVLTPERIKSLSAESCGLKVLYGTEQITPEVMTELENLAKEANVIDRMKKMQAGEVTNFIEGFPSENRPVLHTAMRDFFDSPQQAQAAAKATALAKKEHEKLKQFIQQLDKENRFTDLVVIAIGGSDLGPRSIYLALHDCVQTKRRVHFVGNIDPDNILHELEHLDLSKTLVLVVSKSGTTLETVTNEEFARAEFVKAKLKPEEHFVAITAEGSPMDDPKKYRACFYMWDFVGGRFSTTSMGGAVLLAFGLGYDLFLEFLKGAHAMDRTALDSNIKHNLPLLLALIGIWNRNFLHYPTLALVPYSQALYRFPAHVQQVDMESNGKHIDQFGREIAFETGPIVWGEPGTCAQHSFYQLIHQGTNIIPVEFIGFVKPQHNGDHTFQDTTSQEKLLSNMFAQAIALATGKKSDNPNKEFSGNRPSHIILGKQLTPYTMGALFALYEHKVAFQGFIWNINSFDQEGVQLGKELAEKMIKVFGSKRNKTETKYPLGQAYLDQLNSF